MERLGAGINASQVIEVSLMPRRYERGRRIKGTMLSERAEEKTSRRILRQKPKRKVSPGKLYKEIEIQRDIFGKEEKKLFKKKTPAFVSFCRRAYAFAPSLGRGAKYSEEFRDAIAFLDWDLKPQEFSAAVKLSAVLAAILGIVVFFLIIFTPLSVLLSSFFGQIWILFALIPAPLFMLITVNFVQKYPFNVIQTEQRRALGHIPEIIGYMIMSLKLTPNLEKAVEFAAEHGRGKVAHDFKTLLWNVEIGVHSTLSEGLDELAYKWGKYSKEFKLALMRIRASVLEDTEAKRYALLDKTTEGLLTAVKEKMEQYARDLKMPSAILFYLGVLLPIILFIVLPIGAFITGSPLANPIVLVLIYNVGIPLSVFFFAQQVIKQRPPTYEPPVIPLNYPGLPKKGKMRWGKREMSIWIPIAIVVIVGVSFSMFLHLEGIPPRSSGYNREDFKEPLLPQEQIIPADLREEDVLKRAGFESTYFDFPTQQNQAGGERYQELLSMYAQWEIADLEKQLPEIDIDILRQQNPDWSARQVREYLAKKLALKELIYEKKVFFLRKENDTTPYGLIFGLMLTLAACIYLFVYYSNIYRRKIQLEIMQLESEFKDSLYIIASRLGENKPVEEALRHVKEFLPTYKVSDRVFGRTLDNINLMGMPLESAVFDPRYGSLTTIPSNTIKVGMKVLVDSVRLGVNVAARTLVSLSLQLENSEKVTKMLKELVADISQLMMTMIVFIAPVVLGITTSLFKVIVRLFASFGGSSIIKEEAATASNSALGSFGITSFQQWITPEGLLSMVGPLEFLVIMLVYIIEIAIVVIYYTTKIEEDNPLLVRVNIAKYVPIAMVMFTVSFFAANIMIQAFGGGI